MPKEIFFDIEDFKKGLYALEDTTKSPIGSARTMKNMMITDRGGIGPRPGTSLLGSENSNATGVKGFYNFKKSLALDELLIKAYDDEVEVYSKNNPDAGWFRLKDGFTSGKEFGFISSLVNVDNEDYCIFCNRYEDYQRWTGAVTTLSQALVGAETDLTVASTLTSEIFESQTATGSSATTLTVATANWATSQWVNLYVYITSGSLSGKIRKITANTGTQLTFDTLGSDPGSCTFEIRKLAFPATGTVIYAGTTIAYTGIDTATTIQVASAHAAASGVAVTLVPTTYPANPRGNRMTNYLGRIIVGNVRSALARDSGGSLQGFSTAGSYFVSKLSNPFDFTFSASRAAGEGDIIATPYGGGDITDVQHQEDTAYVFKERYIESVKYSQDSNDLAVRVPLKQEIGSVGQVIKGSDDIYFITADKRFTSIGRVSNKDVTPQTENIGHKIKRILDTYTFNQGKGFEYNNRIYIPAKSSGSTNNDVTIVYNKVTDSFEGIWDIPAFAFERFNGLLYYSESNGANVHQMLTSTFADAVGTTRFPIVAQYATHFMNLTKSKGDLQALNGLYVQGYVKGDSTITFKLWKEFANQPFLQFDFAGTETAFLDGIEIPAFLGGNPIGLRPMGSVSAADSDGRRFFNFKVYFPFEYGNFFSFGFESSEADYNYEVLRFGLSLKESISIDTTRIKSV